MNQKERREYLLETLLAERPEYASIAIPQSEQEQKQLLRSLFNVRLPEAVSSAFQTIQDAYLQEESRQKGIVSLDELAFDEEGLSLWQGDITRLAAEGIVNAANSQMLGCFIPCHGCIDNAIHTYAGVELREACAKLMEKQGHPEPAGTAKITPAFNLPSRCVLHTVGPIVHGPLTKRHEKQLASCYRSCLELADENRLQSLAFCCISTGEFHFPNDKAASIAVQTVKDYKRETGSALRVIFNVFKQEDRAIYEKELGHH